MRSMYLQEFVRRENAGIPDFPTLVVILRAFEARFGHHGALLIIRKGNDLGRVVEELLAQERFPVIDRKSQCIFGLGRKHEHFRAMLYGYCDAVDAANLSPDERALRYITRGHGYYISSMEPEIIVSSTAHRDDEQDRLLFEHRRLRCLT